MKIQNIRGARRQVRPPRTDEKFEYMRIYSMTKRSAALITQRYERRESLRAALYSLLTAFAYIEEEEE